MRINSIECANIKSFQSIKVELIDFNVIIGLNGSGKSNFILLFKVIKDILSNNLRTALSNQGGYSYLMNYFLQSNNDTAIRLAYDITMTSEVETMLLVNGKEYRTLIKGIKSDFTIKPDSHTTLLSDKLSIAFELFDNGVKVSGAELIAERDGNAYNYKVNNYDSLDFSAVDLFSGFDEFKKGTFADDELAIHRVFSQLFNIDIAQKVADKISIYEFEQDLLSSLKFNPLMKDEKETKDQYTTLLHSVLNDERKRRQFFNVLNYILPDIEDVNIAVENGLVQTIMVKEKFHNSYIPASLLSNGTVFLMIIILSLYFDEKYLTIFDEPERTIHPNIISKVVDMMKDAARYKQIILSTHNAEIVKNAGIENIMLMFRDQQGYSKISRPTDSKEIATFLDNDIGLDELFVQNML